MSHNRGTVLQPQSVIMVRSDSRSSQVGSTAIASTLLGDYVPDHTTQLGLRYPAKGERCGALQSKTAHSEGLC